jgi:hypothetical protein
MSSYRWFAALVGLTSLSILLQAVTAGQFMSHQHSWLGVHDVVADVVMVLALATAIFTIVAFRRALPSVMWGAIALFILVAVQTVLGHLIVDAKIDWLVGIHVPLAFIVFGLAGWLAVQSATARRRAVANA